MGWEKPVALPVEEEKAEEPDEKVTKPEETPEPKKELSKEKDKVEPAKEKAKVEPKKKAAKKFSRIAAAIIGLNNNKSIKAAFEEANKLYIESGGKDDIDYASFYARTALKIMAGVGVATVNGDKYTIGK